MRSEPTSPAHWGIFLSRAWGTHFPVDVREIALSYSKRFPDPIRTITAADVGAGFEGGLFPLKKDGWAVLYNPSIESTGRINFTLGHELGHYLCHRTVKAAGFECSQQRVLGFDANDSVRTWEREADSFASYLLMPIDDFRKQVSGQDISLDLLGHCADRYQVSVTAAAIKWIEFTPLCAALVYADNGRVLWARRSDAAKRQGVYFPFGMELPVGSLAAAGVRPDTAAGQGLRSPAGVWLQNQGVKEYTIFADRYEAAISLLLIDEKSERAWRVDEDAGGDTFDRLMPAEPRRIW